MHVDPLLADTTAIRAFGTATEAQAAELAAVAATLAAVPMSAAGHALGPVGAGFVGALTDALAVQSRAVAALGDTVGAGAVAAETSAGHYDAADERGAEQVRRI